MKGKGKVLSFGMEPVNVLPGFSCRRCATCCKGKVIVLTDQDFSRLKPHAKGVFFVKTSKLEKKLTGGGLQDFDG